MQLEYYNVSDATGSVGAHSHGRQLVPAMETFGHVAASAFLCVQNSPSEAFAWQNVSLTSTNCPPCKPALKQLKQATAQQEATTAVAFLQEGIPNTLLLFDTTTFELHLSSNLRSHLGFVIQYVVK